jgi:putative phosphoesterase
MRVGLVSDTHGLVDEKLADLFAGVDLVLHAGDVVKPEILEVLGAIAPLRVVRGNNDLAPSLAALPETAILPVGPLTALLVHDLGPRERPHPALQAFLERERPDVVVHGHSHRPGAAIVEGRLFVNPGSAGPRRFSLPRTAAVLEVRRRRAVVRFHDLSGARPTPFGAPFDAAL